MKKEYFLKHSHLSITITIYIALSYIIITMLLCLVAIKFTRTIFPYVLIVLLGLFTTLLLRHINIMGLYINDTNIYYKNWKSHRIDIEEIAGVKVIQSYSTGGKYKGFYALTSENGPLYTAIILNEVLDTMHSFSKGDLWFNSKYKKQVICSVTYNKAAIEYLIKMNPSIRIID